MAAAGAASTPWQPTALDAEFSPQVAELLRTDHGRRDLSSRVRRRDEGLRAAVKKHLLALGWTILSRPNAAMLTRFRYKAPGHKDKSYCSLPDLIIDCAADEDSSSLPDLIIDSAADENSSSSQFEQQQHQMIIAINNEPPPPAPQTKDENYEDEQDDDDDTEEEQEDDHEPAEEEDDKDAVIGEYIALMATNDRARGRRANRLRDSAKRHLLAAGWTFWMKLKSNGREELRYRAPTGRSYISLHTACQAFKTSRLPTTASNSSSNKIDRIRVHATPATILRAVRPSRVGDEDAGNGHCRPAVMIRKKRKLSELLGDRGEDAVNVMMKKCTTIKKKETCCQVVGADGTKLIKKSTITTTTLTRKKKRKKETTASKSRARVFLRPNSTASACQRRSRTLLSVLIDKDIVVPRDKVTYRQWRMQDENQAGAGTMEMMMCTKI